MRSGTASRIFLKDSTSPPQLRIDVAPYVGIFPAQQLAVTASTEVVCRWAFQLPACDVRGIQMACKSFP